jgi:quercetin dioxygenase-like cupin family protein
MTNTALQIPPTEGVRKIGAGEGEHFDIADSRFTWKAKAADTGYAFAIYELPLDPGKGVPLHSHPYAEVFYILDGRVDFMRLTDGQQGWVSCERGETLIVPPNAFHGFANRSGTPARLLSTANLLHQAFFDEASRPALATDSLPASPPDMAELQRALGLAPKYNMFFAPPPASEPSAATHDLGAD